MEDEVMHEIINACLDRDTISLQQIIDSALKDRVAEALANEKIDIAKTFFNKEH